MAGRGVFGCFIVAIIMDVIANQGALAQDASSFPAVYGNAETSPYNPNAAVMTTAPFVVPPVLSVNPHPIVAQQTTAPYVQPAVPSVAGSSPYVAQPVTVPSVAGSQPVTVPSVAGSQPVTVPSVAGSQPVTVPSVAGSQPVTVPSVAGSQPVTIPPVAGAGSQPVTVQPSSVMGSQAVTSQAPVIIPVQSLAVPVMQQATTQVYKSPTNFPTVSNNAALMSGAITTPVYTNPVYTTQNLGPCPNTPCLNGGLCVSGTAGNLSCNCQSSYIGSDCSVAVSMSSGGGGGQPLLGLLILPILLVIIVICLILALGILRRRREQKKLPPQVDNDVQSIYHGSKFGTVSEQGIRNMAYPTLGKSYAVAFSDSAFSTMESSDAGGDRSMGLF